MQAEEDDSSKSLLRQLLGDDVSSRSLMNMLSQDPRKEKAASNQAKRPEPGAAVMDGQKPSKASKIIEKGFSFGREKRRTSATDGEQKQSCLKKRADEDDDGEVGENRDINSHHLNGAGQDSIIKTQNSLQHSLFECFSKLNNKSSKPQ